MRDVSMKQEDPLGELARDLTKGALEGIKELELAQLDPSCVALVLTCVGDAMRLGVPVPNQVSEAVSRLSQEDLRATVGAKIASVEAWSLPAVLGEEPDPGLEWALRRRDEVESFVLVLASMNFSEVSELEKAVTAHDLSCGGLLTRYRAEQMLGSRLAFGASWLTGLE